MIYLPILLSAYFWGTKGAVIVAILSGILAGPFMPLDVSRGIMQSTTNWIVRIIILTIIGFFTGSLFVKNKKLSDETRIKDLTNPLTGLYNNTKLLKDLEEKVENGENFKAITIKLTDMEGIEKYVNQDLVKKITLKIINDLKNDCQTERLYSLNDDEFFDRVPIML
jgi:predicted signal transduction protein with EAL and GGDEF domain